MTVAEYMGRICVCGAPRKHHAYAYAEEDILRRAGTPRVVAMTNDRCAGFVDAIEREIGYPPGVNDAIRPSGETDARRVEHGDN